MAFVTNALRALRPSLPILSRRTISIAEARVTSPAPFFKADALVNGTEFKTVSLDDYKDKYLVLLFYPLDWTFVCPTEITAHADAQEEFAKLNAEVVAVSTDNKFSHYAWAQHPRKEGGLAPITMTMIADQTRAMSRTYGCYVPDDGFNLRATYIIDKSGVLRHAQITDRSVGRSVDETLRIIKALLFAEEHGEVCPANWQPGSATIKGDPELKKEYFSTNA
ncbi:uncharacterized protein MONBRDRAFT_18765 [Monosiga brevicollis MX1]|uniref:Thioredoxin domain-containing protein n=1 Tax=Monosiga brevicollis TaxID=81824 RepID=A9UXC8_MONBE|nr:uncharacterized protein MONBRDRAFT_18765 [Monosiga brevicollis MX1]EDQ90197.1 predicted protein [Monosiga brevicollis MX1]|eukprot:XP_001744964.1 hypothetical protein [Monosiga brevicollis MX1]